MSKKHKNVYGVLNYIEHLPINFYRAFLEHFYSYWMRFHFCIPIGIASSAVGLKTCVITAAIKKYKSIIKKKKNKHDKIVLLAKSKFNSIEVLTSKALIDSNISHDEFVLINNVMKEYNEMKEEIKNLKTYQVYRTF